MVNKKLLFIYDLDNTLYRESDYLYGVIKIFSKQFGLSMRKDISADFIEEYLNRRENDLLSNLYNLCYEKSISEEEHAILFKIYTSAKVRIKTFEEVPHVLKLSYTYGYSILCTNGRKIVQENKINLLKIKELFNEIVILETPHIQKPNSIEIEKRIEKFSPDSIMMIGDDPLTDLVLAEKIGAIAIRIKRGFYKNEQSDADYEIDNFFEVKNIIMKCISV